RRRPPSAKAGSDGGGASPQEATMTTPAANAKMAPLRKGGPKSWSEYIAAQQSRVNEQSRIVPEEDPDLIIGADRHHRRAEVPYSPRLQWVLDDEAEARRGEGIGRGRVARGGPHPHVLGAREDELTAERCVHVTERVTDREHGAHRRRRGEGIE